MTAAIVEPTAAPSTAPSGPKIAPAAAPPAAAAPMSVTVSSTCKLVNAARVPYSTPNPNIPPTPPLANDLPTPAASPLAPTSAREDETFRLTARVAASSPNASDVRLPIAPDAVATVVSSSNPNRLNASEAAIPPPMPATVLVLTSREAAVPMLLVTIAPARIGIFGRDRTTS